MFAGQPKSDIIVSMKNIVIFIGVLFVIGVLGGSLFTLGITRTNTAVKTKLETAQNELAKKETEITSLKTENETLKNKLSGARAYATFLSLALCPTLESVNKDALCMQDGAEWFNQTIQTGMTVPDDTIKESLNSFLQSLDTQKRTSSKQFYEFLKPLEVRALSMITEVLK